MLEEPPPPRARRIRALRWTSLFFSWGAFLISFTASLGESSLWIGLSAGVITVLLEGSLFWHDAWNRKKQFKAGSIKLSLPHGAAPYTDSEAGLSKAPMETTPAQAAPVPTQPVVVPLAYQWSTILLRIVLAILWAVAVAALVATAVIYGHDSYLRKRLIAGRIVEIVINFAQAGVMAALVVSGVVERERVLNGGGDESGRGEGW